MRRARPWFIPIWVHSNCDEVELFLNDRSLELNFMMP